MKSGVMEEVRKIFKPEFINRIDDIIVFKTLEKNGNAGDNVHCCLMQSSLRSGARRKSRVKASFQSSALKGAYCGQICGLQDGCETIKESHPERDWRMRLRRRSLQVRIHAGDTGILHWLSEKDRVVL